MKFSPDGVYFQLSGQHTPVFNKMNMNMAELVRVIDLTCFDSVKTN